MPENNLIIIKQWLEEGWELITYNGKFKLRKGF